MRPFNKTIKRFLCETDDKVAWRMLFNLPGVEKTSRSFGYYASMRVTMRNGKEFLELPRYIKSLDSDLVCIRRLAIQILKYVRKGYRD